MVSDQELLEAVRSFISPENCPVATADDVAKRVDVERETVRQRLLRLAADQHVRTRKLGRARVFWIPDALTPDTEPALEVELRDEPAPDREDLDDEPGREQSGAVDVDDLVDELKPPGTSEALRERRREALRDAVDALREHGELSKSELLEHVDDTAGYDDGESLWRNWLYEALHELDDRGVAESPGATSRGWRLTG